MTVLRTAHPRRRALGFGVAIAVAATVLGCSPTPEPDPTPTSAFASEEEAFAAAEETYRAYTEALSAVDLTDPSTFELVYIWLDGEAENSSREALSELHAEGLVVTGPTTFDEFTPRDVDVESGEVSAALCLDVSAVEVKDADGRSVVSPDRPNRQPILVVLRPGDTDTGLRIHSTSEAEAFPCGL